MTISYFQELFDALSLTYKLYCIGSMEDDAEKMQPINSLGP